MTWWDDQNSNLAQGSGSYTPYGMGAMPTVSPTQGVTYSTPASVYVAPQMTQPNPSVDEVAWENYLKSLGAIDQHDAADVARLRQMYVTKDNNLGAFGESMRNKALTKAGRAGGNPADPMDTYSGNMSNATTGYVNTYDPNTGTFKTDKATPERLAAEAGYKPTLDAQAKEDEKRGAYGGVLGGKVLGTIFGQPGAPVSRQLGGALGVLGAAALMGGGAGAGASAGGTSGAAGTGAAATGYTPAQWGSAFGDLGARMGLNPSTFSGITGGMSAAGMGAGSAMGGELFGMFGGANGLAGLASSAGLISPSWGAVGTGGTIPGTAANARALQSAGTGGSGGAAGAGGAGGLGGKGGLLGGLGGGMGGLGSLLGLGAVGAMAGGGGGGDQPSFGMDPEARALYSAMLGHGQQVLNTPVGFSDIDKMQLADIRDRITGETLNRNIERLREQQNLRGVFNSTPAAEQERRMTVDAEKTFSQAATALAADAQQRRLQELGQNLQLLGFGNQIAQGSYQSDYNNYLKNLEESNANQEMWGRLATPFLEQTGLFGSQNNWLDQYKNLFGGNLS